MFCLIVLSVEWDVQRFMVVFMLMFLFGEEDFNAFSMWWRAEKMGPLIYSESVGGKKNCSLLYF